MRRDEVIQLIPDGGVVRRQNLLAQGATRRQVRTLVEQGDLVVVRRGFYALPADTAASPRALARAAHLAALRARVQQNSAFVGSHLSAAIVLGLPVLGGAPRVPHVTRARRQRGDTVSKPGTRVSSLDADEIVFCEDIGVTSPARTICDVARTVSFRHAVLMADAALHAGLPLADLERAVERAKGWPGVSVARAVVKFADERAESPLESLNRIAYAEHGLPAPQTQVNVYGPKGQWIARVDFLFEEQRTVAEADGLFKYRQQRGQPLPAWVDDALTQEKQREQQLRECGLEVVRNGWKLAFSQTDELAALTRRHFMFAEGRVLEPGVRFLQQPVRRPKPLEWPLPVE